MEVCQIAKPKPQPRLIQPESPGHVLKAPKTEVSKRRALTSPGNLLEIPLSQPSRGFWYKLKFQQWFEQWFLNRHQNPLEGSWLMYTEHQGPDCCASPPVSLNQKFAFLINSQNAHSENRYLRWGDGQTGIWRVRVCKGKKAVGSGMKTYWSLYCILLLYLFLLLFFSFFFLTYNASLFLT